MRTARQQRHAWRSGGWGKRKMRHFNTEGVCRPEEHYMVRLDDRLAQIKTELVDKKKYFVCNSEWPSVK